MPPQDTDRDLLVRIDERVYKIRSDQKEIKVEVGKINGRLREVEQEQAAMRGKSNMLDGILAVATVIGTALGITVKQA